MALTAAGVLAGWVYRGAERGALADVSARTPAALPVAAGAQPTAHHDANDAARRAMVLATFRGGEVTVGEMEDAIANKLPETRAQYVDALGRRGFLSDLVRYDVLTLEAERLGYAEHPVVITATYRLMIDQFVQREFPLDPAAVPAQEIQSDYEAHVRQFARPLQRRASQIVVQSQAEARKLIAELKDGDRVRFANLARERSDDARSRQRGGDMGYFDREGNQALDKVVIPRALTGAVFALRREGAIHRRPIPVDGGFSIVMWTGENPGSHPTLAQVEQVFREARASKRQQREVEALAARLRAELQPEVHPELADAIALDPLPAGDIASGFPAAPPDPWAPPRILEPDAI